MNPVGVPKTQATNLNSTFAPQSQPQSQATLFGCAADQVQFGATKKPAPDTNAPKDEKASKPAADPVENKEKAADKAEESKAKFLLQKALSVTKKAASVTWNLTKNYGLPATTAGVGLATLLGSQALHLLPVIGSIPAVGLTVIGGAMAVGGAWWGYKNFKKGKGEQAEAAE